MKDNITMRVTCPKCGQSLHVKKKISFRAFCNEGDSILSDFDMEEFHCSCGNHFLGVETVQSEKLENILDLLKELQSQGKFDISEHGMKINLGFSDILKIISELKTMEGVFE